MTPEKVYWCVIREIRKIPFTKKNGRLKSLIVSIYNKKNPTCSSPLSGGEGEALTLVSDIPCIPTSLDLRFAAAPDNTPARDLPNVRPWRAAICARAGPSEKYKKIYILKGL